VGDGSHEVVGKHGNGPVVFPRPEFPKNAIHGAHWLIAVRHRLGSLETAVTQARHRNLAVSFGILAILGTGVVTVGLSSQRARKMASQQIEFAAAVSHEIRTPIAVIRSAAHNLRSGVVTNREDIERYATMVEDEARRLSSTVDQVLLYSKTNSDLKKYQLAPVDVNEIIDRAVNNLTPSLDINLCQLSTQIDPDLPPVLADAAALTQCVQNLLNNAFKYGRKGPCAKIDISASKDDKLNEVKLRIRDNGPGIDISDQRYLFRPFYRGVRNASKTPGSGLGLYLVHRMMSAQGGTVTLDPSSGGGASFTLHIPVVR
jgi:signal transduction histidine kinase